MARLLRSGQKETALPWSSRAVSEGKTKKTARIVNLRSCASSNGIKDLRGRD